MVDKVEINPSATQQNNIAPLGEVLLAARKAKKLTHKDISNSLRLSIKQIDAIEKNEFSLLPEASITRGFIRNYARLLGVDAEPLIVSFRARVQDKLPNTLSVQPSTRQVMSSKTHQSWLKYILGSILVLLFLLAWFFYMDYMPKTVNSSAEMTTVPTTTKPLPLPEVALPAAERQGYAVEMPTSPVDAAINPNSESVSNTVESAVVTPNQNIQQNTPVNSTANQSNAVSVPIAPTVAAQSLPAGVAVNGVNAVNNDAAIAINKVTMSFSEQTWVRVTNQSGKVIFEKIFASGSTGGFDGEPPFNVVIGNAKATQLQYLGKPIDLAASTKSNVARIKLD